MHYNDSIIMYYTYHVYTYLIIIGKSVRVLDGRQICRGSVLFWVNVQMIDSMGHPLVHAGGYMTKEGV